MTTIYPLAGRTYTFKTIGCRLDQADVAANRWAIDELFRQFAAVMGVFRRLIPVRAPFRKAFRMEDFAAARAAGPGLKVDTRMAALDKTIEMWRSFEAKGKVCKAGIPGHPSSPFVRLSRRSYSLVASGPTIVECKNLGVSIDTPRGPIQLGLLGEGHQVPILQKVLRGDEGLIRCFAELIWRPELSIDIHIGRPVDPAVTWFPEDPLPGTTYVAIGVDLGVRNLLVAVAPGKGSKGVLFVKGGRWREMRRRKARARAVMLAVGDDDAWMASREAGGRFTRDLAHKACHDVIELARKVADRRANELPVIVLEDLSFADIAARDGAPLKAGQAQELRDWPFALIRKLLLEKAAWEGFPVMVVPPSGTSLSCPSCGGTDAVRRRDVHRLVCPDCGFRANDDYCAALAIARRGMAILTEDIHAAAGTVHPRSHELLWTNGPGNGGAVDAP
jgi:IS605 OrfB family transposase